MCHPGRLRREGRAQRFAHRAQEAAHVVVLRGGVIVEDGRDGDQLAPARMALAVLGGLDARMRELACHVESGAGTATAGRQSEWDRRLPRVRVARGGLLAEPGEQRDRAREQARGVGFEHEVRRGPTGGCVTHQAQARRARLRAPEPA
jgi:hypothetical protein